MTEIIWKVGVGTDETTAVYEPATGGNPTGATLVCAHGAGGHMGDKGMLKMVEALRLNGLNVVRFNFLYREKGASGPDRMPRLEECFAAVVEHARQELDHGVFIIGGRSMGGRAASMMASKSFECDALLLFAYPLHPSGQPEKLRDAHLSSIEVPVLCFSGTRDALCRRDLMETALKTVKTRWDMQWIEGADHSFHVPKSSGNTDAGVLTAMSEHTGRWIQALSR